MDVMILMRISAFGVGNTLDMEATQTNPCWWLFSLDITWGGGSNKDTKVDSFVKALRGGRIFGI
jgi:hypothetical protein